MYQMPQPGGYPPYQKDFPQGGMPPPGAFSNGGFNPYGNFYTVNDDDESEYEYITDDEGDYIEDEDGTILTIDEAQNRGLVEPAGEGERGIGKKLLIGGAILGGMWILRKQLKKKKKVKKQKTNQPTNPYNNTPAPNLYGQPQHGYGQAPPPQNLYGQNLYGSPQQKRDIPGGFGGPGFGAPGFGGPGW